MKKNEEKQNCKWKPLCDKKMIMPSEIRCISRPDSIYHQFYTTTFIFAKSTNCYNLKSKTSIEYDI